MSYRLSPTVSNDELNALFDVSWPAHVRRDFTASLDRSIAYACAYRSRELVGFVNAAWDGGVHAFVLDVTVYPLLRRKGIGLELVKRLAVTCSEKGIQWLHVDFQPYLAPFYEQAGFRDTEAGLIRLNA
ncbi:MAG: N-acetyltransferase [Dehalococcoidia bacterium]|nr:N-acetyltransferase [Dehalococcoidia bacterium]